MSFTRSITCAGIQIAFLLLAFGKTLAADDDNIITWARMPNEKLRPATVTISKETTYITSPLRPDGWVDYAAAINQRCQAGVTKDNNAAVLYWQAAGPKEIPAATRAEFFRQLGIDAPPNDGDYLVNRYEYLSQRKEQLDIGSPEYAKWMEGADRDLEAAKSRPWKRAKFPVLAGWLDANKEPLALVSGCAKRSKFFAPPVVEKTGSLWNSKLVPEAGMRSAVELLRLRAMQRLAEGRTADAWQDLLDCHRLARLVGQRPFLVNALVGFALEQQASDGDAAFVQHAKLAAGELAQCGRDLAELPAIPPLGAAGFGERLFYLDLLRYVAGGDQKARRFCGDNLFGVDDLKEARNKLLADSRIDWDIVFRACNADFDKMEESLQLPDDLRQREELKRLEQADRDAAKRVNDPNVLAKLLAPAGTSAEISQRLADVLLGSAGMDYSDFVSARIISTTKVQLTDFAIGLAIYHLDHQTYPRQFAELVPRYITAVPKDPFSQRDYIYHLQDGGYILYSVGRNGRDNHGANVWADHLKQFEGETDLDKVPDDLCIRVSKEKL